MKSAGQVAFEAYKEARGGKNHDLTSTPPWEELGEGVQAGWEAAAEAVCAEVRQVQPPVPVLIAVASAARHAQELVGPGGHDADRIALEAALDAPGVKEWFALLDSHALLPVPR